MGGWFQALTEQAYAEHDQFCVSRAACVSRESHTERSYLIPLLRKQGTELRDRIEGQQAELTEVREDLKMAKDNHMHACGLVARLFEAGTGTHGEGPIRGVVEDVADNFRDGDLAQRCLASVERAVQEADQDQLSGLETRSIIREALDRSPRVRDLITKQQTGGLNVRTLLAALDACLDPIGAHPATHASILRTRIIGIRQHVAQYVQEGTQ